MHRSKDHDFIAQVIKIELWGNEQDTRLLHGVAEHWQRQMLDCRVAPIINHDYAAFLPRLILFFIVVLSYFSS